MTKKKGELLTRSLEVNAEMMSKLVVGLLTLKKLSQGGLFSV